MLLLALLAVQAAVPPGDYFIQEPSSRICMRLSIASKATRARVGVVERTREPTATCDPTVPFVDDASAWTHMGRFRCERTLEDGRLALEFAGGDVLDGCPRSNTATVTVAVAVSDDERGGDAAAMAWRTALVTLPPNRPCHASLTLTVPSTQINGVFYSHDADSRICTRLSLQTDEDERWPSFGPELVRTLAPPRGACDASAFAVSSEHVIAVNAYDTEEAYLETHALEGNPLPFFIAESGPAEGCADGATVALTVTERKDTAGDDGAPVLHWKSVSTAPDCHAEVELSVSARYVPPGGASGDGASDSEQACDAMEADRVIDPLWLEYVGAVRGDDAVMGSAYDWQLWHNNLGDAFWEYVADDSDDRAAAMGDARISNRAAQGGKVFAAQLWARLQQGRLLLASTTRSLPSPRAVAALLPSSASLFAWLVVAIPLTGALVATHVRAREAKAKEAAAAAASTAMKALMV